MPRILFTLVLVLVLGLAVRTSFAQSDTTQVATADSTVVQVRTPDVTSPLNYWQAITGSGQNVAALVAVTEEKLDEVATHDPKALEAKTERDQYQMLLTDSLGVSLRLLFLLVVNSPDSHSPYILSNDDEFGILHDGRLIPSLGLMTPLVVNPNSAGHTFAIFPPMEFCSDDQFYVIFYRSE